jgi:hypothetical protein
VTHPSPFLRRDEVRETPGARPGVLVTSPDGRRWFYPGGTAKLGLTLARASLPDEILNAPGTSIAFGEKLLSSWVVQEKLKTPPGG